MTSSNDILIEAKNLSLQVPVFLPNERQLLKNPLGFLTDLYFARQSRQIVPILNNINFTLKRGERLGLIGHNGAGKSTLLRVLARIYYPTDGTLTVNGNAKGLFDIAMGMNQDATGLENIYLRGLQMGLTLNDIKDLIPEIVDFADLEDQIDNPFYTYSSGMKMRLSFSISTIVEPDILLLDEWVGAGDANFRDKVKERMNSLIEKSRGLVLATHTAGLMKSLCTHGIVLQEGDVMYLGPVDDALKFYEELRKQPKPVLQNAL